MGLSEHVWVCRVGVIAHLKICWRACLPCGHPHVHRYGCLPLSISASLQNTEVPTSALRGRISISGLPRDPTHLAGIKLQGLGTLFGTQPERSSILLHLGKHRGCGLWPVAPKPSASRPPGTHSVRWVGPQQLCDAMMEAELPVAKGPQHAVLPGLRTLRQDTPHCLQQGLLL